MCSTLCRASHFFAATAFNWVEMCKKKTEKKIPYKGRQRQTDRKTGIGHVDASAHQKGLCCCCCCRCTLYIYLHVDCVSIANWLPGFFHLNCQLLLHWHWHSLAIADVVAGVAWLQVTVSRSHWKGCQSFTLYRAPSLSLSHSFSHLVCVCLANWPLHKYLPAHMFLATLRKLRQQQDMRSGVRGLKLDIRAIRFEFQFQFYWISDCICAQKTI